MKPQMTEEFYNPFGPNILQTKISESVRLKLLNLVKDHLSQDWKERDIIGENTHRTQGDKDLMNIQNNTLVSGKMGIIDEQWQRKQHG